MPIPIGENPDEGMEYVTPQSDYSETQTPQQKWGDGDDMPSSTPPTEKNPYAGWDTNRWARALINPSQVNAAQLREALERGWVTQEMARAAEIMKDWQLHAGNTYPRGSRGGIANNLNWQNLLAANPDLETIDWQMWQQLMGEAWPAGYSPEQPVLSWNPAALPQQYRQGAENWFKQQGLNPSGSLGQYGYTRFQRPKGSPYKPISIQAFNAIPDEQLRQWMLYLGSSNGLIPGNYRRPTT